MALYNITLESFGGNKISTIKAIRTVLRIGLVDAKRLADAAPILIKHHATQKESDQFFDVFRNVAPLSFVEVECEVAQAMTAQATPDYSKLSLEEMVRLRNGLRHLYENVPTDIVSRFLPSGTGLDWDKLYRETQRLTELITEAVK